MIIIIMILMLVTSSTETKTCTVAECTATSDYYEVTVEDENGNLYAYYDDTAKENGTEMTVVFDGDEIIDVR